MKVSLPLADADVHGIRKEVDVTFTTLSGLESVGRFDTQGGLQGQNFGRQIKRCVEGGLSFSDEPSGLLPEALGFASACLGYRQPLRHRD